MNLFARFTPRLWLTVWVAWGIVTLLFVGGWIHSNWSRSATSDLPVGSGYQLLHSSYFDDADGRQKFSEILALTSDRWASNSNQPLRNSSDAGITWVRIVLKAQQRSSMQVTLGLQKPAFVEVNAFMRPNGSNESTPTWARQTAGTNIDRNLWDSVPGLSPRFVLPTARELLDSGASEFNIYLRVDPGARSPFRVHWFDESRAQLEDASDLAIFGLSLGLMGFGILMATALAVSQRNSLYAWYAAYVCSSALALMSQVGLGQKFLWNHGDWLSPKLTTIGMVLALYCLTRFARVAFVRPSERKWSFGIDLLGLLVVVSLFSAVFWTPQSMLIGSSIFISIDAIMLAATVFPLSVWSLRAFMRKEPLAIAWMFAILPLGVIVAATLLEASGFLPETPWLHGLGLFIATTFEVTVLGVALQAFARKNLADLAHRNALASTDPLTGFIRLPQWKDTLATIWSEAGLRNSDFSIAYVEVRPKHGGPPSAVDQQRCVRILRTVTGPDDVVAQLDSNIFALLMPSVRDCDVLAGRMARLVALGLMCETDADLPRVLALRAVCTTFREFRAPPESLDLRFRRLLNDHKPGDPPVHYCRDVNSLVKPRWVGIRTWSIPTDA